MTAFAEILGHAAQRRALWRALEGGRMPHAVLIQGGRGVGKRTLAVLLARTLLCRTPREGPCGECPACRKSARGLHPDIAGWMRDDVYGPDPAIREARDERVSKRKPVFASEITVGFGRAIAGFLETRAFEGPRRVALLVEAQRMNEEASNALLKSLEEPAPGNVAILTSSAPTRLLPTIRSRCSVLRLSGVPQPDIERELARRLSLSATDSRLRASACGGSLGRALDVETDRVSEMRTLLLAAFESGPRGALSAWAAAERAADKAPDENTAEDPGLAPAVLMGSILRDLAVLRAGGGSERLVHRDHEALLRRIAETGLDPWPLWERVRELPLRMAGQGNRLLLWDEILQDGRLRSEASAALR